MGSKIKEKIDEFAEQEDMDKPFYFNLFSKEIVFTASLLQSIYTWLGGKWEEIAEIIATENFPKVERRFKLHGEITPKEQPTIELVVKAYVPMYNPLQLFKCKKCRCAHVRVIM
ncbi:TdeIII family type II restriction endonuclease [Candidatus Bathyarchaeota archaeon]|nr:TdeIII family type II restriction endonuclease [Candidatus Bathyarchaeota archaeon]